MIFFAVASPTPGNSFSSAALALFKSTFAAVELALLDALGAVSFVEAAGWLEVFLAAAGAEPPTVTRGVIFFMVAAETPALDKSLVEEYGRPPMIFLAVAAPTPGKLSNCCSVALFRSTFAFALLACPLGPELASVCIPNANVVMAKNIDTNFSVFLIDPP